MSTTRKPAAVSMDPALFELAKVRALDLGFPTFSAYVCQLIRRDIAQGGGMNLVQENDVSGPLPPRRDVIYQPARPTSAD
jgi:hypothetical protein